MKQYYIVSLKWTSRADSWITLWRVNAQGYTINKEWAGTFCEGYAGGSKEQIEVDSELIDPLFVNSPHEGAFWLMLPNTYAVCKILGLDRKKMRHERYKTC